MFSNPWAHLKELEILALATRGELRAELVDLMRQLVETCGEEPDADEAILYHGALAILHEHDGRIAEAVREREIELGLIRGLYDEVEANDPETREFALQNYCEADVEQRRAILAALRAR